MTQAPYNPVDPQATTLSQDDRVMAMLCHLLGFFTSFIGPLIIYLIKKDESPFVRHHAAQALNFQITIILIAFVTVVVGILFMIITLGIGILLVIPLILAINICDIVFSIIGGVSAYGGKPYYIPLAIPFVR